MLSIQGAFGNMMQRLQEAGNVIGEKPHLRDWSEVLMLSAAIYCLRAAVLEHKKNTPPIKNGNLWVFGTLSIAELRIRQLWITATLDSEAKKFEQDNKVLQGEIKVLKTSEGKLQSELSELRQSESSLRNENADLSQNLDRMGKLKNAERLELQKLRKTIQDLSAGEEDVGDAAERLTSIVEQLRKEKEEVASVEQRAKAELQVAVDEKRKLLAKEKELNLLEERLTKLQQSLEERA